MGQEVGAETPLTGGTLGLGSGVSPAQALRESPPSTLLCLGIDYYDLIFMHDTGAVALHGGGYWPNFSPTPLTRAPTYQ